MIQPSKDTGTIVSQLSSFLSDGYLIENPPELQHLSVAAYRLLAEGSAVNFARLANAANLSVAHAEELLRFVPASAYEREPDGSLSAFIGLSTKPTLHRFSVEDRSLYTWCVFDAVFLPAILQEPATLTTSCPTTGDQIDLTITPTEIAHANLPDAVMSILAPDMKACCADLRGAFCDQVNLFANRTALLNWDKYTDAIICAPLDLAFTLATHRNDARFPDVNLGVVAQERLVTK